MLTFWFEWWRAYWMRLEPKPQPKPFCSLEDLDSALTEYLESSRDVAERAAKNVEDAQRLKEALEELKERKRQHSV
jgi:hypothetical protein